MKIKNMANGAILWDEEGNKLVFKFNYFEDQKDWEELVELLYIIAQDFRVWSRHDKYRLSIKIEHGDKYECKDRKKCLICKKNP